MVKKCMEIEKMYYNFQFLKKYIKIVLNAGLPQALLSF